MVRQFVLLCLSLTHAYCSTSLSMASIFLSKLYQTFWFSSGSLRHHNNIHVNGLSTQVSFIVFTNPFIFVPRITSASNLHNFSYNKHFSCLYTVAHLSSRMYTFHNRGNHKRIPIHTLLLISVYTVYYYSHCLKHFLPRITVCVGTLHVCIYLYINPTFNSWSLINI